MAAAAMGVAGVAATEVKVRAVTMVVAAAGLEASGAATVVAAMEVGEKEVIFAVAETAVVARAPANCSRLGSYPGQPAAAPLYRCRRNVQDCKHRSNCSLAMYRTGSCTHP